jgi:cholesterol oxidase
MNPLIDTLVIGSGFGGSVVAARLVEAGAKVTLLERGPWRDTAALAAHALPDKAPLPQGRHLPTHLIRQLSVAATGQTRTLQRDGFFDIHVDGGMTCVASSGVGGGSHVYLAMNMRPERADYWENRARGLSAAAMEPHYDWMLQRMGSRTAQARDHAPNLIAERFADHAAIDTSVPQPALGFRFGGPYGNNAFLGDTAGRKVTLDALLLAPLLDRGLTVLDRHEAVSVAREGKHWRVEVRDEREDRHRFLRARRVVLAAGTLNTLRLLHRSERKGGLGPLPALGQGFSGNGDVFALWRAGERGEDFRAGPPCLGRFTLKDEPGSPMLYALGLNGIDAIPGLPEALRRRVADWLVLVGMGRDEADGRIGWQGDTPRIGYQEHRNPVMGRIHAALGKLSQRSGRRVLAVPPTVTVHPLGGARVGDDPQTSVIDPRGEVHGHPGLYISDGSALPAAPGTPPSMTIAAWAGHVSQQLLATGI